MYQAPKQDYSWSLFRHYIFNYCERAYYYHYYASLNGWDKYASEEARISFRLKHLKTKELWLKIILKKSLQSTICEKPNSIESFKTLLRKHYQKTLTADIRNIYLET